MSPIFDCSLYHQENIVISKRRISLEYDFKAKKYCLCEKTAYPFACAENLLLHGGEGVFTEGPGGDRK